MSQYIQYGDQDALVVEKHDPFNLCPTDVAGFHTDHGGRRTTRRLGVDGYAYRCEVCGAVGDIREGRFVTR